MHESSSLLCSDFYMFAYHGEYKLEEYYFSGSKKLTFKKPSSESLLFDLKTNGIRLFKFHGSMATTLAEITSTVGMFIPEGINYIPEPIA